MDQKKLNEALSLVYNGWKDGLDDVLINGDARGADKMSTAWAAISAPSMIPELYPVTDEEWKAFGKYAGVRRNTRMARESKPDVAVCFRGGTGTRHMVTQLHLFKCPFIIIVI